MNALDDFSLREYNEWLIARGVHAHHTIRYYDKKGETAVFVLLFLLWIILNGQATGEIVLSGIVLSALIELFLIKFMGYSIRREIRSLRLVPRALRYCAHLVREIMRANRAVMRLVLSPGLEVEPQLRSFRTPLRTPTARAVLADSITLTPGTITVRVEEDEYLVHSLDSSLMEGIEDTSFQRELLEMEAMSK